MKKITMYHQRPLQRMDITKFRNLVEAEISDLEKELFMSLSFYFNSIRNGNTTLLKIFDSHINVIYNNLADFYLECSYISPQEIGKEYALKALILNPDISVHSEAPIINDNNLIMNEDGNKIIKIANKTPYSIEESVKRSPSELTVLEQFLRKIKAEVKDQYLKSKTEK